MFTSIIVPTFDNYDQLADCVQSIHNTTENFELIIVDNGDKPLGYTDPVVRGMRAARGDLIIALNDDVTVEQGWQDPLLAEAAKGTWVFSPDHPTDQGKALGWFLCFSREGYIGTGGFDTQFTLWCADVDLFKRCLQYDRPPVRVAGPTPKHAYSTTTSHPDWQNLIKQWQQEDLAKYRAKWGSDPNVDKLR